MFKHICCVVLKVTLPDVLKGHEFVAASYVHVTSGNLAQAFISLSLTNLVTFFGSDVANDEQMLFLKRFINGTLSEADEKKLSITITSGKLENFIQAGQAAPDGTLCISCMEQITAICHVILPEKAAADTVKESVKTVRASDYLKGFRIFDSGTQLTQRALRVADKLPDSEVEVKKAYDWFTSVQALGNVMAGTTELAVLDRHFQYITSKYDGELIVIFRQFATDEVLRKVAEIQMHLTTASMCLTQPILLTGTCNIVDNRVAGEMYFVLSGWCFKHVLNTCIVLLFYCSVFFLNVFVCSF